MQHREPHHQFFWLKLFVRAPLQNFEPHYWQCPGHGLHVKSIHFIYFVLRRDILIFIINEQRNSKIAVVYSRGISVVINAEITLEEGLVRGWEQLTLDDIPSPNRFQRNLKLTSVFVRHDIWMSYRKE